MSEKKFNIGVDAGGTKTRACLFDGDTVISEPITDMGNPVENYDLAMNNIQYAIDSVLHDKNISSTDVSCIGIGCAGADSSGLVPIMVHSFEKKYKTKIIIKSDVVMSHIATFNNKDGVLLISGTGSAVINRGNDKFIKKGGWGPTIGDQGSAYWIGIHFVKQLTEYMDDNPVEKGFEELVPKLQETLKDRKDIIDTVYLRPKKNVANLSLITLEFPDNLYVKKLLNYAGLELSKMVLSVITYPENTNLAIEGSVIKNNAVVRHAMEHNLTKHGVKFTYRDTVSGSHGVLFLS
ncbi:hypothetical protein M5C72_11830 [Companilactobacillus allii]|uniref:ATPase BadF/BadG/BcrA/BcrD type domain-containing protein n=1 Tax=Companilactobacillus allii TaxID=1847728 RepID=A0A1P8Q0T7_9LACO|nr:BadF/BadG/BcrA/BcrD ATPase family protein [Companilactobacillus allii]APX71437.1 hypothetical protein BTM29_02195 [Companilactobacillus allii]USQ68518.1 hypothetical protein M5C72_11830 [Companilactobacillus allii]